MTPEEAAAHWQAGKIKNKPFSIIEDVKIDDSFLRLLTPFGNRGCPFFLTISKINLPHHSFALRFGRFFFGDIFVY